MRRLAAVAAAATVAAGTLTACSTASEGPRIVVTTNILGDVVETLVGDQVEVATLMQPNADPHSFEISAQQAASMERADLVVANGLGLEEGLVQHVEAAADAGVAIAEAGDAVEVLEYATEDASGPDPHWWTDPTQTIAVVDALEQAIAANVDGIEADALAAAADEYRDELEALDADLAARFDALGADRRVLVTNHHVFGYLAERYDFRIVGAVIPGGSTLAAPSASDLDDLATAIEETGVPVLFAESSQPDRLIQVLAEEAGVDVRVESLFTESLTEPGGGAATYVELMRTNADRIEAALAA
ncbi:zinc ABC transporter substrate-binding protein AztC [Agrococcus sp. SGAir0287]|uniref:zinc ABC transporter substrate-binding protein AztC n=1 Tax=Agrococcus sp. SGAir0287 TaxID=2070347 RepID=UPI0010CD16AF|nr:zinc ABC transporter substrate-binding protein AztC [Agrococcus sp. SGAir0287]QCR18306.1 zinc ABC transporter substrate-binding protein [Agrococcus sp. SGAir0287]